MYSASANSLSTITFNKNDSDKLPYCTKLSSAPCQIHRDVLQVQVFHVIHKRHSEFPLNPGRDGENSAMPSTSSQDAEHSETKRNNNKIIPVIVKAKSATTISAADRAKLTANSTVANMKVAPEFPQGHTNNKVGSLEVSM